MHMILKFIYENWQGKRSWRRVIPSRIYFGATEYHKEPQWLMEAFDVDKQVMRTFAMASISGIEAE